MNYSLWVLPYLISSITIYVYPEAANKGNEIPSVLFWSVWTKQLGWVPFTRTKLTNASHFIQSKIQNISHGLEDPL